VIILQTKITLDEAKRILAKYNTDAFHIKHGETVSAVMGYFASKLDAANETYWRVAGMLHDVDFEQYPDEHCVKGEELLRGEGAEDELIRSALSHGWGMTGSKYQPAHQMENVLYAVDELTGLIGAAAIMRPSKSTLDLELSSVKKKFKDKRFAAGCSRETIAKGAELMGVSLDELISETILAMRQYEREGQ
jgi:predicted hydrolase (HD superfamily)